MITSICDEPPEPGYWQRRDSRFPLPMSRHLWSLFIPAMDEGTRRAFARYGCALDYFDFACIRGRQYLRAHSITTAEELIAREKVANDVLQTRLWRQDCASWSGIRDGLRRRLLDFAHQDPCTSDTDNLRENIVALRNIFVEGTIQHFLQQPASMIPVGDWIRNTREWTGASAAEVITLLRCCPIYSGGSFPIIDALADSIRASPAARMILCDQMQSPATRLERLRHMSSEIAEYFEAYNAEYADRIITGFDISDATLRELPGFTVAIISSRIEAAPGKTKKPNHLEELRDRVPLEKLAVFDEGLDEARTAYGLHDDDVRITYLWPLGLLRRCVLAAADRLMARGALRVWDDVFQTTPAELDDLMCGGSSPSAAEISRRADQWRSWANDVPPASFGEKTACATDTVLGPACARVTSAIRFYLSEMEGPQRDATQPAPPILRGLAASEGCYEGRARIVRNPADFAKVSQGDVLVARTTSPAYNVMLPAVGAIVTDRGGTLCHAAILAREFRIPAVVSAAEATSRIPDGAHVLVDGSHGFVAVREM